MTARTPFLIVALTLGAFAQNAPPPKTVPAAEGKTLVEADDKPIPNAQVSIQLPGQKPIEAKTDARGKLTVNLPWKDWGVSIEADKVTLDKLAELLKARGGAVTVQKAPPVLAAPDSVPAPLVVPTAQPQKPKTTELLLYAALLLGVYWIVALLARYHSILKVNRELLRAAIRVTEEEIAAAADESHREHAAVTGKVPVGADQQQKDAVALGNRADQFADDSAQAQAQRLINDLNLNLRKSEPLLNFFFGTRGRIAAGWSQLYEAQRILSAAFTRDQVLSHLRLIVEQLRPEYSNMADKIDAVLAKTETANPPSDGFLRATLNDGMRCSNEKKYTADLGVLNWQNKAFALIFVGACLLFGMVALLANPVLLFVGFIGGFASRLMRGKGEGTKSFDAELTWTNLFLSPIYGAFSGWGGILLLIVLKQLNVIGNAFEHLNWDDASTSTLGLGLAFLFGFSERYFAAITDLAEGAVLKDKNAKAADSPDVAKTSDKADVGIPNKPPIPGQD